MQLVSKAEFLVKRLNVCNPKPSYYKLTSLTKTKVVFLHVLRVFEVRRKLIGYQ